MRLSTLELPPVTLFRGSVASQVFRHWPMKLWLGSALTAVFCVGYFTIERYPSRPPTHLPLSSVDRWVGFSPGWAVVYQSLYLLTPLGWLARTREELWRYAAGFLFVTLVGFACFVAWPVAGPRPADVPGHGASP
jgi:hypothetical protein